MPARLTTEKFIAKSIVVHGDGQYDYGQVNYRGSKHKVTITCKVHGDFEQIPNSHLKGKGCGKCGGSFKSTTEEFIAKSNSVHGREKYCYKKVDYRGNLSKVTITCKIHGDFEQTPSGHLSGYGCAKCSGNSRMTKEEFISKAVIVHGDDQYDYSKVDYRGNRYKVIITCKTHGDFEQKPNSHLNGQRCGKCHSSKCEQVIRKWLEKRNYPYKQQARFASCRNKNPLPFDFSVDGDGPIVMLIEFHGTQHYEPHSFRHSSKDTQEQKEANLARVQLHDAIKAKWCADNNIPLLVIPYWDRHRIPELLEEFLGAPLVGARQGVCHTRV